jgi:RNA polymerase sigma-70 factor, ECF subfamily
VTKIQRFCPFTDESSNSNVPAALSLKEIYESEFRCVWRNLARLGVPEADVADATQEVFLVVYRRLAEFDGACKVSTWLYRICFNVASDRRRRAHVRREIAFDSNDLDQHPAPDPSHMEDLALFDRLLESMEMEQRAVFVLFEVEGHSGAEIAEMMNCPMATVYSRLRLARAAFARAAERYRVSLAHTLREAAI